MIHLKTSHKIHEIINVAKKAKKVLGSWNGLPPAIFEAISVDMVAGRMRRSREATMNSTTAGIFIFGRGNKGKFIFSSLYQKEKRLTIAKTRNKGDLISLVMTA
jgi:TnpA family transposase